MSVSSISAVHEAVTADQLNPETAGEVIIKALRCVNDRLKESHRVERITFIGQPVNALEQTSPGKLLIHPDAPLDLAIDWPDKAQEPIDFVNVVKWCGYDDAKKLRLTEGFYAPEELADIIFDKLEGHLKTKENPNILISATGSKYSIEHLKNNTLAIDAEGYLRLNNLRIWADKINGPLEARSLRSSNVIAFHEYEDRIALPYDKEDCAPSFYIMLTETIQKNGEEFYLLSR